MGDDGAVLNDANRNLWGDGRYFSDDHWAWGVTLFSPAEIV